ncbi:MAG: DNA-protecting protein DprA [Nitrososphaerota archaeon]|jgi:DNA processing protein|nr:DNA-protecting protein DprA [Nitrososphaerota archaeon]
MEQQIRACTITELIRPLNDVEKKHAPEQVYIAGKLPIPLTSPRAAIIGSRKASQQGLEVASTIAKFLAQNKVIIVSGLAEGIDTAAHTSTIEAKGQTVAVLGTPLNKVYPKTNSKLQERIIQEHLAISQFPNEYPILPRNFILRNKTMAIISDASIIIEAGSTSGTIHQGWEAIRLRRPLFIWHQLIQDTTLTWPKKMVEYGAIEFSDPKEILEALPPQQITLKVFQ